MRIPTEPAPSSEFAFQLRVQAEAERRGWSWIHIPRSRVGKRWLTRAKGPLAKGWPDLLLIRAERLIFAELKAEKGRLKPEQAGLHPMLAQVGEVYVWRPSDWDELVDVLH